ncbi:MAG TPA: hypothetical protein VK446_14695 [Methylocystis sp.]|nr:hypothetical protein [Methylocystis sp.]
MGISDEIVTRFLGAGRAEVNARLDLRRIKRDMPGGSFACLPAALAAGRPIFALGYRRLVELLGLRGFDTRERLLAERQTSTIAHAPPAW